LSQVQSTPSVTEMTESVGTDIYFPEFGSLAKWSLAEVFGGKQRRCHIDDIPNSVPVLQKE